MHATRLVQDSEPPHCQGSGGGPGSRPDTGDARCPVPVPRDCRPPTSPSPSSPSSLYCTVPAATACGTGRACRCLEVLGSGDHADAAGVSDPPTPGRTGRHLSGSPPVPVSITADAASSCWEVVGDRPGPLSVPEVGAGPGRARGVRCSRSSLSRQNWLKSLSWGQLRPRRARTS